MKYWAYLWALILILSMGACSSEEWNSGTKTEITAIDAVIGELLYEESRTSVSMGGFNDNFIKLVWAEKDTIGIYPVEGDQLSFPVVEGIGTNKCSFDGGGWALKTSTSYKAYSPFNRGYYYQNSSDLPVSMLGQKQVGNGTSGHLSKYDLQVAEGKTPSSGKISFEFKHQVCFVRMDLTAPSDASWKLIRLESDALFTTEATMDIASEPISLTGTSTSNSVTLELENVETEAGGTITAYMAVLPVNLTGKTLDIVLTDSNGDVFRSTAVIANDYRNFKAGYARWIKAAEFVNDGKGVTRAILSEAGTLLDAIGGYNNLRIIERLKITGPINGDDVYEIRRMSNLKSLDLKDAVIKEGGKAYYDGYTTKDNVIGTNMFYLTSNLEEVILPVGVEEICGDAFHLSGVVSVTVQEGLKSIGVSAFSYSDLASIEFPSSLEKIEWSAFLNTNLKRIEIPENVKEIGKSAFQDCKKAEYVRIKSQPGNITIGDDAFSGLYETVPLYIPKGTKNAYINTELGRFVNIIEE